MRELEKVINDFILDTNDLMWRDLFTTNSPFFTITQKVVHPIDIYETDKEIRFEIAAIGLNKDDIDVSVEGDILQIKYQANTKLQEDESNKLVYRGIKRSSFNLAWKISAKFDLSKLSAKLDKGALIIEVPFAESQLPKKISIK